MGLKKSGRQFVAEVHFLDKAGRGDEKGGMSNAHAYRLYDRRRYCSRCAQRHGMASRNAPAARPKRVFRWLRPWGVRDVHFGLA